MSIEGGDRGQGENPDVPKPPNHEPSGEQARSGESRPFNLYRDSTDPENWVLEVEVEGSKMITDFGPRLLRYTREEYIERIRESLRIIEEHNKKQKPDQGPGTHQ